MLNDLFSEYRFLQYTPHDRHKILYLYLFFGRQWKQEIFLLLEEMGEEFFLSGYRQKVQVYCHHVSIKIVRYFYDLYDRVGSYQGYMVGQENIFDQID
jgi:hypothetical protein